MRWAFLILLAWWFFPQAARAEDAPIWNAQWENDIFVGTGTDKHYTNGMRLSVLLPEDQLKGWVVDAAHTIPWFPEGGRVRPAWSLGHSIFTPEDIKTADLIPEDRPYAGWLYLGAGLVVENGRILDITEFTLGVVGPAALGQQLQKGIHAIVDSPDPQGWDHQLHNELTLQATWQRKWRQLNAGSEGFGVDVLPHMGAALGNVFIYGAGGASLRLGWDLPADYGPPRIQPSLPGSEYFLPTDRFSGYLFLGGEGRVTLRNMFLDGNTFGSSHSVDKRILVGDLQGGAALVYRGVRLAYTYVVRSREFTTQNGHDRFGAFTLSARF